MSCLPETWVCYMTVASNHIQHFNALRIGATAGHVLSCSSGAGKVFAIVSNCIYLVEPDDQLFWMVNESVPMHARSIQLAGELPDLLPGDPFQVKGRALAFPAGIWVNAANADAWKPHELPSDCRFTPNEIYKKSRRLYSHLLGIPRTGFGRFIEHILALAGRGNLPGTPQFSDHVLQSAWPAVLAIAQASICRDLVAILPQMKNTIGLGEGLTPSGDDFLGGLFFGLHALNELSLIEPGLDMDIVEKELGLIADRTNLISSTVLKDLVRGQGLETIHDLFRLLVAEESSEPAFQVARRLASIGHSTGWDVMTGLLVGLLWTRQETDRFAQGAPQMEMIGRISL